MKSMTARLTLITISLFVISLVLTNISGAKIDPETIIAMWLFDDGDGDVADAEVVAGRLRAACVKVNITPDKPQWLMGYGPRQSEGIHDNLYHRIVAMDDGKTQFFLVSTDICVLSPSFYDEFCKELEKETGIEAEQVWWTVTHTHSAPEVGSQSHSGCCPCRLRINQSDFTIQHTRKALYNQ